MKRPEGIAGPPQPSAPRTARQTSSTRRSAATEGASPTPKYSGPTPPREPTDREPSTREPSTREPSARELRRAAAHARREARALERQAARGRRRAERGEVRRFTRHSRRRRALVIGTVTSFSALVAGVIAVTFSPLMSLTTIEVTGTQRLDPAQVTGALDGHLGTPLAFVADGAIGDDLAQFALIRSYSTEIVPPNTLIVRIVERAPVGAVSTPAGFELVDAAGVVVDTAEAVPEGLPLIELASGEAGERAFASVADVLISIPRDMAQRVETVTATTRDDVTFELRGSGHIVIWGDAARSAQKARVLDAAIAATDQGTRWVYDVSAPDSLVVRDADG
ncbi:MAG: FtsQ-type POTRA domain-containing protein [Microcella sp.]